MARKVRNASTVARHSSDFDLPSSKGLWLLPDAEFRRRIRQSYL